MSHGFNHTETSLHLFWCLLTFLNLKTHESHKNNKDGIGLMMKNDVMVSFRARAIYQKKDLDERVNMVVIFWL